MDESALHDATSTIVRLRTHRAGHILLTASDLLLSSPHSSFEPFLLTANELSTELSRLEDLQPANTLALTKKKKAKRSERNAQREQRKAAAEAARGGFVGGSSCGVAAIGSAGGPSGSAGGDDEVEEQQGMASELFVLFFYSLISYNAATLTLSNGYPSLNLNTRVESFGLPPAINEATGAQYPALSSSPRDEKPKVSLPRPFLP